MISGITGDAELVSFSLTEHGNMRRVIETCTPDEIYNLAAQSFVGVPASCHAEMCYLVDAGDTIYYYLMV